MSRSSDTVENKNDNDNTQPFTPAQKSKCAAGRVEKSIAFDDAAPRLTTQLNVTGKVETTFSGLVDEDYSLTANSKTLKLDLMEIKCVNTVPVPSDILDNVTHAQCLSMMGLFPEINRAWLTVDTDIYIWTYEENVDLAYYDGISETILCVGLIHPKPGIFHPFIKYLLVLATGIDIVTLGVTFTDDEDGGPPLIQLLPDAVFTIPTDGVTISVITGTVSGRIFLGSKEGNLYEVHYQAETNWFGKRSWKVNLSTSTLSFLIPSFLNSALIEDDGIVQISIDNSRHILYTLTQRGTIEVFDLGDKCTSFCKVSKMTESTIVAQATQAIKTLDSQTYQGIQSITAIEARESANINLVAVSHAGVRFYFSVASAALDISNPRPYCLLLVHVRLPPGYSANASIRPKAVQMSHYRERNQFLISSVQEKNLLWCISSDLFPFSSNLVERFNTVNLDGAVLAIAEVPLSNYDPKLTSELPPLVVRQHTVGPKKIVVLTSHSVQVFLKLRPVDILRDLLRESHGYESDIVKNFFCVQKADQACVTSLILASLDSEEEANIAEYATKAFFMYGGEPTVAPPQAAAPTAIFSGATGFAPNMMSTPGQPISNYHDNMYTFNPNIPQPMLSQPYTTFDSHSPYIFSAKHNGLCIYLSRILRPIWSLTCVERIVVDPDNVIMESNIGLEDCARLANNLSGLHNFLLQNTQLSAMSNTSNLRYVVTPKTTTNQALHEAQLEERRSLDALKCFVNQCCQIVSLWRLLSEHPFYELIETLPEQTKQLLQSTTFKELFIHQHETICPTLINMLINSYLIDDASVDSIIVKLREICPNLYKQEDAAFSKANELLQLTRKVQNMDEKEQMIMSALKICKGIVNNINLNEMCKQFCSLKAYNAVIELCGHFADLSDPDHVARKFYYEDTLPAADAEGHSFWRKRMTIYREISNMLDILYAETYKPSCNGINENPKLNPIMCQIVDLILEYPDDAMHVALYQWMLSKQMMGDLIKIKQPSLEVFLKRNSTEDIIDNIVVMDLLWKYYESNEKHAAAATILNNLASKLTVQISLKDRLNYLARAIMCMRSDKTGYSPYLGLFLRDLEDKMEVAKVQELILDAVANLPSTLPNTVDAMAMLNTGLYEISQLYENFADPYKLLECQLAIINVAGYSNCNLIESIWQKILTEELRKSAGSANDRMGQILSKVQNMARQYSSSVNCFPLAYIIHEVEMLNARLKGDKCLVPNALVDVNIPIEKLLKVYNNLILVTAHDQMWQSEENEFHLPEATAALILSFVNNLESFTSGDKKALATMCEDTIASLLSNLYTKSNSENLINHLRSIQATLSRI